MLIQENIYFHRYPFVLLYYCRGFFLPYNRKHIEATVGVTDFADGGANLYHYELRVMEKGFDSGMPPQQCLRFDNIVTKLAQVYQA